MLGTRKKDRFLPVFLQGVQVANFPQGTMAIVPQICENSPSSAVLQKNRHVDFA